MEHSEQLDQIAAALAKAQAEMPPAKKSGLNPHFKSAFSTLEDVCDSFRGPFTKNGLALVQLPGCDAKDRVGLGTMILHSSGQWISDFFPFPAAVKQDPQGMGAACSYFRRYASAAAAGVVTEDDDAESAMDRGAGKSVNKPRPEPAAKPAAKKAEPREKPTETPAPIIQIDGRLSDAQLGRFRKSRLAAKWSPEMARDYVQTTHGKADVPDLSWAQCQQTIDFMERHPAVASDFGESEVDELNDAFPFENPKPQPEATP